MAYLFVHVIFVAFRVSSAADCIRFDYILSVMRLRTKVLYWITAARGHVLQVGSGKVYTSSTSEQTSQSLHIET